MIRKPSWVFVILLLLSLSLQATNPDKVEVVFTNQMTKSDLLRIQKELSKRGMVIEYSNLKFNEAGKLTGLQFFVICEDGFMGGAQVLRLQDDAKFGFLRDFSSKELPFLTGFL
jgi:hypothetical protein